MAVVMAIHRSSRRSNPVVSSLHSLLDGESHHSRLHSSNTIRSASARIHVLNRPMKRIVNVHLLA